MRAWLEALEDKSLPSLEIDDPEGEVASAIKVSLNFNGEWESNGKRRRGWHYQSTCRKRRGERGLASEGEATKEMGYRRYRLNQAIILASRSFRFCAAS